MVVAHDDRSRNFNAIANYAGYADLIVSCIKTSYYYRSQSFLFILCISLFVMYL